MSEPADLRLIHHHIGGRAGDTGFPVPEAFRRDLVRVLYDADADSVAQSEQAASGKGWTTMVRPYFIGAPGRKVAFHINYCPYTSSARSVAPEYLNYHVEVNGTDYVYGEAAAPVRTIELESHGLDEITLGKGADLPPPDLLSIDTEGGENDVIAGAQSLLANHVVAVIAEVKFNPAYIDGPLFGDISASLAEHGFLFVDFEHIGRMAPMRGRFGTRGYGLAVYGDGLYYRDPAVIVRRFGDRAGVALRKLAFTAICRGQFEFAQHCLAFCPPNSLPAGDIPIYLRFVDQFQRICESMPDLKPWSFIEAYSVEASHARFTTLPPEEAARVGAEARARANAEADKITRNRDALIRAVTAPPLARLFERYGMADATRVLLDMQKQVLTQYGANVAAMAGRMIEL